MAQVLSPLIPTNDPVPSLRSRSASSEQYSSPMSAPMNNHQPRNSPLQRGHYSSVGKSNACRGSSNSSITPYAFRSTPQWKHENRANSALSPTLPPPQAEGDVAVADKRRCLDPSSTSTSPSSSSSAPSTLPLIASDDSILFSNFKVPELSILNPTSELSDVDRFKNSPNSNRWDRHQLESHVNAQHNSKGSIFDGVTASGVFGNGNLTHLRYNPQHFTTSNGSTRPERAPQENQSMAVDPTKYSKSEAPKRYRRRGSSGTSFETGSRASTGGGACSRSVDGSQSMCNDHDTTASSSGTVALHDYALTLDDTAHQPSDLADVASSTNTSSPLSQPLPSDVHPALTGSTPHLNSTYGTNATLSQSPAVAAMAALNIHDKDDNKGVKSRFRRAFSFGATTELKRVMEDDVVEKARVRREQFSNELDEEQVAIAKKQEASGLGNSIYTGQGGVFSGSTDNLSISSTASSASLMLRKMGKGMKKGGRSLKGLFRPKSVIGVPAADGPSQPSIGHVSMVTVEAEREQVNVNLDPHDQAGGGTGYPRLEKNSVDMARTSIHSMQKERFSQKEARRVVSSDDPGQQELLTANKRGILKRTTSSLLSTPKIGSADSSRHQSNASLPSNLERPGSSAPSTASSELRRTGHRRTDSHTLEGEDYFAAAPRFAGNSSTRSLPGTPRSMSRNISFSPRIQFHDVWSSSEYDRRGDIATCNRLTPMLAQQIKEELNTFKMEMEVHELSKPHTHFF